MAGTYADIPGTRFALDQDGTVIKWRNYDTLSAWTDVSAGLAETQKVNIANYLEAGNVGWGTLEYAMAFPEARDISGIYIHPGASGAYDVNILGWESSTDTTDGTDGAWSPLTVTFNQYGLHNNTNDAPSKPYYRSDIATLAEVGVKGIRLRVNNAPAIHRLLVLHIYGNRPVSGVDRLAFWHSSVDQVIDPEALDFGDIAQGASVVRQFRVKNISASLTANNITVQVSDLLPEYSGSAVQVSTDNATYLNSINIGNLASGTISPTLHIRRTVGAAESTILRQARLLADAASWT